MRIICGALLISLVAVGCGRPDPQTPGNAVAAQPAAGQATTTTSSTASPPAAGVAVEPARPAEPAPAPAAWREVTIPTGTQLVVSLDTAVSSETSRVEEPVTAHLTRAVHVGGETALAEGTRVSGVVTDATRAAKVKGLAHVALRFTAITPHGADERYTISTSPVARTAEATKQKDAMKIGAPAAGGAIIGALLGGKKGALVGTAIGGGAGTAAVLSTRGKEVHLAKGAALTVKLSAPVTVRVKS